MTTRSLHIAKDLVLPLDAATQTFAFIARKGAGKTYTAGKLVELLLEAHVQVVVLDTVGNWYGLRIAADGKGTGFDVPVLGGLRGDIPLEAAGGALIADIVVETGRSVVLDVSQFSLADRKRFATAFGERLWLRKKGERHPAPLHLVIEESQLIVPQFTGAGGGDIARMLGIYEEIIRLGRNYGIGVSMITQRPQSVNKEVLNQTECLFVGQVNGAQERDALKKWITHQGMDVHLVDELPGLKIGTFYVWSPQWLNLLQRVEILKKTTFDASATPKVGDKRVRRDLKPLDLADLQEQLKATIEKAKADDPRELRKQLAEAKRELAKKEAVLAEVDVRTKRIDEKLARVKEKHVEVLTDADRSRLDKLTASIEQVASLMHEDLVLAGQRLHNSLTTIGGEYGGAVVAAASKAENHLKALLEKAGVQKALGKLAAVEPPRQTPTTTTQRPSPHGRQAVPGVTAARLAPVVSSPPADGSFVLGKGGDARMLAALAQIPEGMSDSKLAILTGMTKRGGSFRTYLSKLRIAGLVEGDRGRLRITAAGQSLAGDVESLPTGEALLDYWRGELGDAGARKIFDALIEAYPNPLSKADTAAAASMELAGGSFRTYVSKLRVMGLIEGSAELRASDELFS